MQNLADKLLANEKMLNKTVLVVSKDGNWTGEIVKVKDVETFLIKRGDGLLQDVDIYDIRSLS